MTNVGVVNVIDVKNVLEKHKNVKNVEYASPYLFNLNA